MEIERIAFFFHRLYSSIYFNNITERIDGVDFIMRNISTDGTVISMVRLLKYLQKCEAFSYSRKSKKLMHKRSEGEKRTTQVSSIIQRFL